MPAGRTAAAPAGSAARRPEEGPLQAPRDRGAAADAIGRREVVPAAAAALVAAQAAMDRGVGYGATVAVADPGAAREGREGKGKRGGGGGTSGQ
jgi:hypothetical protein